MTDGPVPLTPRTDPDLGRTLERYDPPSLDDDFWHSMTRRLALEPKPTPKTGHWFLRRPVLLATTAAAAAAVIALVALIGLPFTDKSGVGSGPATAAAQMLAKLEYAMAHAGNMSGTMVARGPGERMIDGDFPMVEWHAKFIVTSDGDYRAETLPGSDSEAPEALGFNRGAQVEGYDTSSHTHWWITQDGSLRVLANASSPLGSPSARWPATFAYQAYASTLKAMLEEGKADVEVTTVDGKPAWSASYPILDGYGTTDVPYVERPAE